MHASTNSFMIYIADLNHVLWLVTPQRLSIVDGMRTIALKLEFGVSHNQTFER